MGPFLLLALGLNEVMQDPPTIRLAMPSDAETIIALRLYDDITDRDPDYNYWTTMSDPGSRLGN